MGDFYAWTTTGQVTRLTTWTHPNPEQGQQNQASNSVSITSKIAEGPKFSLRQRDGTEVEIILPESDVKLKNGQIITTVWAARQGAQHGHCVFLENHTTNQATQLQGNVNLVRPKIGIWRAVRFGLLATIPAAIAMLLWLLIPTKFGNLEMETVLFGGLVAISVLFLIGLVIAKLVFDFLRSEDEQKLWRVTDKALVKAKQAMGWLP
jgi:hypothetical protein